MTLLDNDKIQILRRDYQAGVLDETHVDKNPLDQFKKWLDQAILTKCPEPNAFTLSTISSGRPRSRIVLFKGFYEDGLTFFTNYLSDKGKDIESCPFVSLTFFWHELERQIRIEGQAKKVPRELSENYFKLRPKGSQIGAVASTQSSVVERSLLEKTFNDIATKFEHHDIICPEHWGGYIINPSYFEFWQGRENRLHDRICYKSINQSWQVFRLAP